jgi:hypothetical protein
LHVFPHSTLENRFTITAYRERNSYAIAERK